MRRAIRNANDNMTPEQTQTVLEFLFVYDYLHCARLMEINAHIHTYQQELEDYRNGTSSKYSPIGN
jgi:hypothetical protein